MDNFGNGVMRMRVTIEGILTRGNYIRMIDGRYTDGFVDLEVLRAIIKEGGAELFNNHGVKMARRPTPRAADSLKAGEIPATRRVRKSKVIRPAKSG